MVSLWSQINSILLWWSESDVWSEGIRQLGAIVGQFRAALKRSFVFCFFSRSRPIRVLFPHSGETIALLPPVNLIQINTSVCSGVMQPASCRIGPPEERDCRHKDDTVLQPLHCFLPPPQQDKSRDESKPCEPLVRSLERLQQVFNGEQTAYERSSVCFSIDVCSLYTWVVL